MNTFKLLISGLFLCLWLSGCASFAELTTPVVTVKNDLFDGSIVIVQEPVAASSSLSEASSLLGFHWKSLAPHLVVLTVSVAGNVDITDLQFNAGGQRIKGLVPVGKRTRRDRSRTTRSKEERVLQSWGSSVQTTKTVIQEPQFVRSLRSFALTYTDFEKISRAGLVVMRVFTTDSYITSSFGSNSGATVNATFGPFLEQITLHR